MTIALFQINALLLIIARIAGVFTQAPVFNSRSFNTSAKAALAVWLALILWFVTPLSPQLPSSALAFVLLLINEVAFGFLIGLICNVLFIAIQSAGEMMDVQMGLSVAQALDPTFGAVISVIGRLTFFTALTVFLVLDGHHMLLSALHQSFTVLPAGQPFAFGNYNLVMQLSMLVSNLWLTALKIAAPILLLIFISDFTFGIVSRVAPQVNVFMLGFQVKPSLGLFAFTILVPFLIKYIGKMIEIMGEQIILLFSLVK